MGYEYVIKFKKPFIKCIVPGCKRKHHARGFCEQHYGKNCRGEYRYSLKEYQDIKMFQKLKIGKKKELPKNKEKLIKNDLYKILKEANITTFRYKDVMNITGWKYERVKKHILRLVKDKKAISVGGHSGGKKKQSLFKMVSN